MRQHVSNDLPDTTSQVSPHDFRLPFNELTVFEEALFVGFMDVPMFPSHLHAPDGRTTPPGATVTRTTASPWSLVSWQSAVLGIMTGLGLLFVLLIPSSDPAVVEAEHARHSLAIEFDLEPRSAIRDEWLGVPSALP
jgi:hypothetical protein